MRPPACRAPLGPSGRIRPRSTLAANLPSAEARRRLQFVTPGDVVFVVHAPPLASADDGSAVAPANTGPWYGGLWDTLTEEGQ